MSEQLIPSVDESFSAPNNNETNEKEFVEPDVEQYYQGIIKEIARNKEEWDKIKENQQAAWANFLSASEPINARLKEISEEATQISSQVGPEATLNQVDPDIREKLEGLTKELADLSSRKLDLYQEYKNIDKELTQHAMLAFELHKGRRAAEDGIVIGNEAEENKYPFTKER